MRGRAVVPGLPSSSLFSNICLAFAFVLAWPLQAQEASDESSEDTATESADESIDYFARDTFRIDTFVCPFKNDIEYEPGEIECGLFQVPENRENPDSRFIELHFVKLNSTWDDEEEEDDDEEEDSGLAPGKRDDPIIYLSGGPGAQATYYVERFEDHGIRKHRDMYILEQRGVGYSDDFCPYYSARKPELFDVETYEEQLDASITAANDCTTNAIAAGVDVTGYNTIENARDVHAFRRALGIEKWNVWGISYGTILGQAYIKEDPEGILAIVLDAIVPLNARDEPAYWRVVNWYDRDLKKLDELCQADPGCAKRYPDLGERIRQAAKSVANNPIVVDVKETELYPSGKARFFSDIVAFLPFIFFYEQSNYPGLPGLIYTWADAVENRDEVLFKALAQANGDSVGVSRGMYDAIFCLDGYAEAQIESGKADLEEFPILAGAIGTTESAEKRAQRCHELGMGPRDSSEYGPVETDIPTLLIEGDMDPITPPPLAKAILPGFSNATYVEFPYAGHGPSRSVECAGDMLNKFFDDPSAEPDVSCVDEMEVPDFYTPLYTTRIAPRLILKAAEDKKSLIAPAAWGGLSVLVVLIAFIFLSVAPIGRLIDKRKGVQTFGARSLAWLAALFGTVAVGTFGAAMAATYDASELLLIFGTVSWAWFGAVAGVLAGLCGVVALVLTIRARRAQRLPIGTLLGLLMTGAAAVSLSSFLLYWDLGPF